MKNLVIISLILLIVTGCSKQSDHYISFGGFTQGTTYQIIYESVDSSHFKADIETLLAEFDSSLSTYNKLSVISKVNRNESDMIDEYMLTVLHKSEEIYHITDGAFDITVAPLTNAWGFGFKNKENMTREKVDSILAFIGFDLISYTDSTITKSDPRIMLDMNAIAQGYSVDVVADFLEEKGVHNYLVEIGGEIKTKGINREGKDWKIGIDKPVDNNNVPGENLQAIIRLADKALATSGNYRKFYEENGVKYSHTINPITGYSVNHSLLSATVIANDCITADAFATAFMVMGIDEAYELAMQLENLEAYFIFSDENGDYQYKMTPALKEMIEVTK